MPRPLQKRRYPKPAPVTVRTDEGIAVLPAEAFPPRRSWNEVYNTAASVTPIRDWAMEFDQRLLALEPGDAFTIGQGILEGLWWFVTDVNGIEQTVTGQTVLFDVIREQTVPFDLCEPIDVESHSEAIEANIARERLGMKPCPWPSGSTAEIVPSYLPARYADLVKPYPTPCHGFANACQCQHCLRREVRRETERSWHSLAA